MERWRVPHAVALELIEFPGKLGASSKRPQFEFTARQQRIASYLAEIDAAWGPTAWIKPGRATRSVPSPSPANARSSS
jgi:hypothetical protein